MKAILNWLDERSQTFTYLTGEKFTRGEVLATFAVIILFLAACGIAETF